MYTTTGQYIDPAVAQQDALRPVRNFINALSVLANDQTWSGTDAYAINPSGQFAVQTPYGTSVEGQPQSTSNQSVTLSPGVLLLIIGGLILFDLKK